jgi:formic-like protein
LTVIVSLENLITDIHELEKGMEMTRRECEMKKPPNLRLSSFIEENEVKLAQLQKEQRIAVDAFS